MAYLFEADSFGKVWDQLINEILLEGSISSPRGLVTKELLNVTLEVTHGLKNILVNPVRDLNFRFMISEWMWILAGLEDLNILAQYNSVMRQFSDDGYILSGAYGPRLMPQIPYILESLNKTDSRQAVATIWTPSPAVSKDVPCTISLQWLIRYGFLNCTINMRSSDAWLGLPYDFFTFSQLTNYVAVLIGRPVGSVTMNLASSHLYSQHFDLANKISSSKPLKSPHIPRNQGNIDSSFIKRILNQEPQNLDKMSLWASYSEALCHSKSHALEVLHELSGNQ